MWLVLSLSVFIFPSAVDSWCTPNTYGSWHSWSSCSASCGGGTHRRYKESCVLSEKKWDTGSCNTICYNRGTYSSGRCRCQGWRYGQCCENCNYGYKIKHCVPSSVVCGGHPDNVKCTHCIDPYYSGGYGGGCISCPDIDNCESRHCTSRTNTKCLHCIEDNAYFKRTQADTRCERLCAWNNHYCWPGSCSSDKLTKNCQCAHGFTRVSNDGETSCQLSSTNTPSLGKCETWIRGKNGEMKQSASSKSTRECKNMDDMYGNFLPYELTFDVAADFTINITATLTKPDYISEYNLGITDSTVNVKLRSVTGSESIINTYGIHEDDGTGTNALSTVFKKTTLSIGSQAHTLQNGEWLCMYYEAKAGGYLKSFDLRQATRMPSSPVPYRKTVTQKELCYRFDNSPPEHCSKFKGCNMEPLQISNRITRSSIVSVAFKGWSDPIPNRGNKDQISGIESYEITVHNVDPSSGSVKVITTAKPVFLKKVGEHETSIMMNLTSDSSRLYAISLAIKDVADNVQYARRFVLIDNSSFIETDQTKSFYVKSASKKTNSTWQIHHNDICITWKDYFYNREYQDNLVLNPIEPDPSGLFPAKYDQFDKPLPISGTENVYGITNFLFSWQRNDEKVSNEISVPHIKSQQYCKHFDLHDGESYTLNIRAVDIVNNSLAENRTVHIDRSIPFINNMCLTKDNEKQLFVHDQVDLSKMELYFESFDPHSGINTVEWAFGTSDAGKELVTGHTVPRRIKTNCPVNGRKCYCPNIGDCEIYAYTIGLNSLVHINKDIGQHNRNYFFTVKVTNNALLTNTEHLDILVDDSPPVPGVVFEGPLDSPDIDYTSENQFRIHWHGFIDHESGIRRYKVGVSTHCLSSAEITNTTITSNLLAFTEIPYTERSVVISVNSTSSRMFTTVAAVNNALEMSDVVCTDGITIDTFEPQIRNVTLEQLKWSETILCHHNKAYLMQSNIKIMLLHQTNACINRCNDSSQKWPIAEILPNETARTLDIEASEFLCSSLPSFDSDVISYLPHDHLDIEWDIEYGHSQIEDFYVGIANDASEVASPAILKYKSTSKRLKFRMKNIGVGSSRLFYVLIKATNKAGLSSFASIGPVLIDETPPQTSGIPKVAITQDDIIVSWENDTFYDLDQREQINQVYFEIATKDKPVSPLLEWRLETSRKCSNNKTWCIEYPLKRLQHHDTDTGLDFYVTLYVYNNAGHFVNVETEPFKVPSKYPPGNAIVIDIDPKHHTDHASDVDIHFTASNLCAVWQGFHHHENLRFDVGVGSIPSQDNILTYRNVSNRTSICFNSTRLLSNVRYYILVKASCSGGQSTSVSDGVVILTQEYIDATLKVYASKDCNHARPLKSITLKHSVQSLAIFQKTSLHIGLAYRMNAPVNVTMSVEKNQGIVKSLQRKQNFISYLLIPTVERPKFKIILDLHVASAQINITECSNYEFYKIGSRFVPIYWIFEDGNELPLEYEITLRELVKQNMTQHFTTVYRKRAKTVSQIVQYFFGKTDVSYTVAVAPCANNHCLKPVSSETFTVTGPPNGDIDKAEITRDEINDCFNFTMGWKAFKSSSPLLFYQWSISNDMSSMNLLTNWTTRYGTGEKIKVQDCLNLPITIYKSVFGCVRGFSADGQMKHICKEIKSATTRQFDMNVVYDVDAATQNWKQIKETLTSSNIGDLFRVLHDSEIDFGTPKSEIAGVVLYATERKVDWYLMNNPRVPFKCDSTFGCLISKSSNTGYTTFKHSSLQLNTVYYICAVSNETYVERELFRETLKEIHACSDGFLIDDKPPTPGKVEVSNINGYITDLSYITITWDHFYDNVNATQLRYISNINSYSFGIGKRPKGDDIVKFTDVGISKVAMTNLTDTLDGTDIYVSIKAFDHAGFSTLSISTPLTIDTSPPTIGTLLINNNAETKFINTATVNIRLIGFHDQESGVSFYQFSIGTNPILDDVIQMFTTFEDNIEIKLPSDIVKDGYVYYINCQAVNRADLSSSFLTKQFVVDRSEPTGGQVIDGSHQLKSDQDFQEDIHHISVYWKGFHDIHSDIHFYRAGLGSEPYLDDIETMVDIRLTTECSWNGSFVPGQRYYTVVEACNKANLCTKRCSNGIVLDNSPPLKGLVQVGTSIHQKFIPKSSSVHIKWYGFEDPQSDIDHFDACVGTKPEQCDILPYFPCLLHSSIIKTGLALPTTKDLYATVRVYNKVGMYVAQTSDAFRVDDTPPVLVSQPTFVLDDTSIQGYSVQWDPSVLKISWQFEDAESPIVSHSITLKTHHEGHTPVEMLEIGSENSTTIVLDEHNLLKNGDRYYVEVTCCNAAGHCTLSTSNNLLIDSSPPHLGGFKPPMTWKSDNDSFGNVWSKLLLSWYGFGDQESGIARYYITVSRSFSGNELSDGELVIAANNSYSQETTITVHDEIHRNDKIILSIWAQNKAGLNSTIARVSVYALIISSSPSHTKGVLELEKHSCETHYCNKDCTCAIIGKPCTIETNGYNCTTLDPDSVKDQTLPGVVVYGGSEHFRYTHTASSTCLTGHWKLENIGKNVSRYEWSMGLVDQPIGEGIFNLKKEIPWKDVGLRMHTVHCLPANHSLLRGEQYLVYVKVWYSSELSSIFKSNPITIDQTPPAARRGKFIKDSDLSCKADFDYIDWMDTITACWNHVFSDQESKITHFIVALGTSPKADDIYPRSNVYLNTSITLTNLTLAHGTVYYINVIAFNSLGMHTCLSSDGFKVDMDVPVAGVVFNTLHHRNQPHQSSKTDISISWHGFLDHHSGIKIYLAAILEENQLGAVSPTFINVGLNNSYTFQKQGLLPGKRYVGIVKAVDAAGHESNFSISPVVKIDLTPPYGLQCLKYLNITDEKITCSIDGSFVVKRQIYLDKDRMYEVLGRYEKADERSSVLMTLGRHTVDLPLLFRFDQSAAFTYVHRPIEFVNTSIQITGLCTAQSNISVIIRTCSEEKHVKNVDIGLKQIRESVIQVDTTIVDDDSYIKKIYVGLGTTRGAFQVKPLTLVLRTSNMVFDVDVAHGASIYATIIAENYAGLRSVFYSNSFVMDKTAPFFSKKPVVTTEVDNLMHTFHLEWDVEDKESGIKQCLCAIGKENEVLELPDFIPTASNRTCSLNNVTVEHGDILFARVLCVNGREMLSSASSNHVFILIDPPTSNKASINSVPTSTEVYNLYTYQERVQSNLSYIELQWSGFEDNYVIDHYEYCLSMGSTPVLDWTSAGRQTMIAINKLRYHSGSKYTAKVKAIVSNQASEAVECEVLMLGSAPKLTGKSLRIDVVGQEMEIDWSMVFEAYHDVKFTLTIGTRYGYNDIIDSQHTDYTSFTFIIPKSTLMSQRVSEIFFDLTCSYITGMSSSYRTKYTVI